MENELYLNRSGLEADIKKMRDGLDAFQQAVAMINAGVDAAPQDWKGASQTAYMERYHELRTSLTKDVPEAVSGLIDFIQKYLNSMMESDANVASGLK